MNSDYKYLARRPSMFSGWLKRRNHRKVSYKKPILLSLKLFLCLILFSAVILGGILFHRYVLTLSILELTDITVKGNSRLTEEDLIAQANLVPEVNIFSVDLDKVSERLLENPWVESAKVIRDLPHAVEIRITERTPIAIVNLGTFYYLDASGKIFKPLDPEDDINFPIINGLNKVDALKGEIGTRNLIAKAIELLKLLENHHIPLQEISEIYLDKEKGLSLYTTHNPVQIILGFEGYSKKWDHLEQILTILKENNNQQSVNYIDLDYPEMGVVKFSNERGAKS